jgi:hypothetical protein
MRMSVLGGCGAWPAADGPATWTRCWSATATPTTAPTCTRCCGPARTASTRRRPCRWPGTAPQAALDAARRAFGGEITVADGGVMVDLG